MTIFLRLSVVSLLMATVAEAKMRVVTTTTMITDMVTAVGGERISVEGLMQEGVDPHSYKTTARDVQVLQRAEVIFYNGLYLEGRMGDVLVQLSRRGKGVYAVTESVARERLLEPEAFEGHYDPHVWLDPRLWAACVETVVLGLSAKDPAGEAYYRERANSLQKEYADLFIWAESLLADLPVQKRVLVTSHDAFNYFGEAFSFEVVGVQGISTVNEAGLADVSQTVALVKQKGVSAIFVESSVAPAVIEQISKQSGAGIGGELFSDAMGVPGDVRRLSDDLSVDVGTYAGMFRYNVWTVWQALSVGGR